MTIEVLGTEVDKLVARQNFLGAWARVKHAQLDDESTLVLMGQIAADLVLALQKSRLRGEDEQVKYLRSILTFILREFPSLAPLYRQSIEPASFSADFGRNAERAWNGVAEAVAETAKSGREPIGQLVNSVQGFVTKIFDPHAEAADLADREPGRPVSIRVDQDASAGN